MVGGGEVRATACATWPLVLREWREMEPVETGWRGLAFRDPWDKRPVVLIATDDLARLLALTEQMASEAGRFHAKS